MLGNIKKRRKRNVRLISSFNRTLNGHEIYETLTLENRLWREKYLSQPRMSQKERFVDSS